MVLHFFVQLYLLSLIVSYAKAAGGSGYWDYSVKYGPATWIKNFQKCNGTQQSPIDIIASEAIYDENLGNITFENYGKPTGAVNFTARNNGHTFLVELPGYTNETVPTIKDGGLPGTFQLLAYHFHWGQEGAEHHINSEIDLCELHMVHANTKYAALDDALNNTDGLAVLGILVHVGKWNEVFAKFLNQTKYNVTYPKMTSRVETFDLMSLIPSNQSFYRYHGSLTTPSCQESVTWTVFANKIEISQLQFNELTKMMQYDHNNTLKTLVDNDRPPQPLNGRLVKRNFADPIVLSKSNTTTTVNATASATASATVSTTVGPTVGPTDSTTGSTTKGDGNGISGNFMLMITSLFLVATSFLKM